MSRRKNTRGDLFYSLSPCIDIRIAGSKIKENDGHKANVQAAQLAQQTAKRAERKKLRETRNADM